MTLRYDPEFQAVYDAFAKMFKLEPLSLDDIEGSARRREASMEAFIPKPVVHPGVEQITHPIDTSDGHTITVVRLRKRDSQSGPGPALLHFHGGGMIMGSAESGAKILPELVMEKMTDDLFLSPRVMTLLESSRARVIRFERSIIS